MIHTGKCLLDTVTQVIPRSCHQLLITCLCLLILILQHLAFVINRLKRSISLPLGKHTKDIRRQPRQLICHIAYPAVIMILFHRHGITGEILPCQFIFRLLQRLNQFLHRSRIYGKSALQQLDIDLCRHTKPDLLQLPSGSNVTHTGFPESITVIVF